MEPMKDAAACYNCRYWGADEQRRKKRPSGFRICHRVTVTDINWNVGKDDAYVFASDSFGVGLATRRSFCCSLWQEDE